MRILKKVLAGFFIVLLLFIGVVFIFLYTNPEFGGVHQEKDIERYQASGHYEQGKFVNLIPTSLDMNFDTLYSLIKEQIAGNERAAPQKSLPILAVEPDDLAGFEATRVLWFGHSAFLLQIEGKNILLDPMLGEYSAPLPFGPKRFNAGLPIEIEALPQLDMVLISHDHYDHLDYSSIKKLKSKTKAFLVPLGVGVHLKSWDVDSSKVHEYNWWDEAKFDGLNFVFAPSRHFSGRGLTDRSTTLWGSWVIRGEKHNIYFSGDGGYGPHFKTIGNKYGPFDFAMLECGQYNEKWAQIHMMPEETIQAAIDVNAKYAMPIHWGAFTLALHDWDDPIIRAEQEAIRKGVSLCTPKIGEFLSVDSIMATHQFWWKEIE